MSRARPVEDQHRPWSKKLHPPLPYSLQLTALSHGWINLPPFDWDAAHNAVKRTEYLPGLRQTVSLSVTQTPAGEILVTMTGRAASDKTLVWKELSPRITRALSLHEDLTPLHGLARKYDRQVLALLRTGGGRLLRGTTFFEDVVKTLLTTNASWNFTRLMTKNIVALYGHEGGFPCPHDLEGVTEERLRKDARIGYRSRYLIAIVETFLKAGTDELPADTRFLGLAEYGAVHASVLRGDYSRIPVDSEVRAYCREQHGCDNDTHIGEKFAQWEQYAFLGYKLARQARKLNWIGEAKGRANPGTSTHA